MKMFAAIIYWIVVALFAAMIVALVVVLVWALSMAIITQTELSILSIVVIGLPALFQWACKRKDQP